MTATENILMLASGIDGTTRIKNAAYEPHVQDLALFLTRLGVSIEGIGTSTLTVQGVREYTGARHSVIPDTIEAGTFLIMGLATGSPLTITGCAPDHLDVVLATLASMGAQFDIGKTSIRIKRPTRLKNFKIDTRPYPGIPTDLQSLFGILATQCEGTSLIHDTLLKGAWATSRSW